MKNKSNFKGCFLTGGMQGAGNCFKAEIMGKLKLRATWVPSWTRNCRSLFHALGTDVLSSYS